MRSAITLLTMFLISQPILAGNLDRKILTVGSLSISYSVMNPTGDSVGDVLYLHGYGDTISNHRPLFSEWTKRGLRVIAFDFPSHGLTTGAPSDDLDLHSFTTLAHIAAQVLNETTAVSGRPLAIAGWSTGGLVAVRIAQEPKLRELFPTLKGLILYAPGVAVRKCPGNRFCHITNETLTHAPDLQSRVIRPASPLYRPDFATRLVLNSYKAWHDSVPHDLPMLVFVAGEEKDRYVNSGKIKRWVQRQRERFSAPVVGINCPSSRHELDNEPIEFGGRLVREQSAIFASGLVTRSPLDIELAAQAPCHSF